MISYAELNAIIGPAIDEFGSQRYLPDQNIIPAMNSAVMRAVDALGYQMANNKAPEEALRELNYTRIFQTNAQGGINLSDPALGHGIWNVLAIYAEPETQQVGPTILPVAADLSVYRGDLSWGNSGQAVERITQEEVAKRRNNMFLTGNEVLAGNPKMITYAYYIVGNAATTTTSTWANAGVELRLLPQSQAGKKLVAMSYIKNPSLFVTVNDSVEFPTSFARTLGSWALEYITWRDGSGTAINAVASKDAAQLFATSA